MKITNNLQCIYFNIQKLFLLMGIMILSGNNLLINAQIVNAENDTVRFLLPYELSHRFS